MNRLVAVALVGLIGCDGAGPTADDMPDAMLDGTPDGIPDVLYDGIPDDGISVDDGMSIDGMPDTMPDAAPDAGPPPPWPALESPAPFDDPLARAHPAAFERQSRWHQRLGPPAERPGIGFRGAFAIGNGRVFGLSGLADPPTTLHNIAGPTYDRGAGFFGDQTLSLADGPFTAVTTTQGLSAPIVVHRACRDALCLDIVDLADGDCILRHVRAQGGPARIAVTLQPDAEPLAGDDGLLERRGERTLVTRMPGAALDGQTLSRPLADGEAVIVSACAAANGLHPGPAADVGALLDEQAADWQAERAERVAVAVPDPVVADFIDGVARNLAVQTSSVGAVSPMHRYTRLWLRDSIGPMLAWLDLGAHARAAAVLDVLDGAIRRAGDLRNSMPADVGPMGAPPAPDYAALPPLAGRTGAEGPSYLVWMHWLYWKHTGETARARAALPLLRRALLAQAFEGDRLPFSGDETFRIALNVALELPLDHPHEQASWSANSLALWLGAAPKLAELARALDDAPLADAIEARMPAVQAAAELFFDADGCLGALIDRETDTLSAPFEDASLKPTWTGWLAGRDARAVANVRCLVERLGQAPGIMQSPLAPPYVGLPVLAGGRGSGVFTGMQPAYVLAALTAVEHPHAPHAFAALGHALLPDGMPQEYQVRGDEGPFGLSLLYDATGREVDQTPKLRPWEGGIALHAVVEHLLGFAPDAPNGALTLAPRLPPGWDEMAWRRLRVGPVRVDVAVQRVADGVRATVAADGPLRVRIAAVEQLLAADASAVFEVVDAR